MEVLILKDLAGVYLHQNCAIDELSQMLQTGQLGWERSRKQKTPATTLALQGRVRNYPGDIVW